MTSEYYLIVSYFSILILAIIIAILTYIWLRPSVNKTVELFKPERLSRIIKKIFPISLLFPILFGFFSTSYKTCDRSNYEDIIADKMYIIKKNQEQVSEIFLNGSIGIMVFGSIISIMLIKNRKNNS